MSALRVALDNGLVRVNEPSVLTVKEADPPTRGRRLDLIAACAMVSIVVHPREPRRGPSGRSFPDGPPVSLPIRTAAELVAIWQERDRRYARRRAGGLTLTEHTIVGGWRRSEVDRLPVSERARALLAW